MIRRERLTIDRTLNFLNLNKKKNNNYYNKLKSNNLFKSVVALIIFILYTQRSYQMITERTEFVVCAL